MNLPTPLQIFRSDYQSDQLPYGNNPLRERSNFGRMISLINIPVVVIRGLVNTVERVITVARANFLMFSLFAKSGQTNTLNQFTHVLEGFSEVILTIFWEIFKTGTVASGQIVGVVFPDCGSYVRIARNHDYEIELNLFYFLGNKLFGTEKDQEDLSFADCFSVSNWI